MVIGSLGRRRPASDDVGVKLPVALVQLDATDDVAGNIDLAVALTREAAEGAPLVSLPEYLQYRGSDEGFGASACPIPGPHTDPFADVARRSGAWILVGSTAETSAENQRPYNTSTLIAPDGSTEPVSWRLPGWWAARST